MIIKAEKVIITRHDVSRFPLTVLIRFINGHLYRYSVALSLSLCVCPSVRLCMADDTTRQCTSCWLAQQSFTVCRLIAINDPSYFVTKTIDQ